MKILKFYADWCAPCKVMAKKLEGFDACEVVSVNVDSDEGEPLSEKFKIRNLPTMVLVDDEEKELERWTGLVEINKIRDVINSFS